MDGLCKYISLILVSAFLSGAAFAQASVPPAQKLFWLQVRAATSTERSAVADIGVSIEMIRPDYVAGVGNDRERQTLLAQGRLIQSTPLEEIKAFRAKDFPTEDGNFHTYKELSDELTLLAKSNPDIVALDSIGKSVEGREIYHLRISTGLATSGQKPGIVFMGGHHAREHISIETPLRFAQHLVSQFRAGDSEIHRLLEGREVHIIPMVNPDGAEYDVASGKYEYWRKNRSAGTGRAVGVDLNRNYGWQWGTGGSSSDPSSETYKGPSPFSEPETQVIKRFVENQKNLSILLSFHTFSELILYPWGHTHTPLSDNRDLAVHKTMAETMAKWNGYEPMQSSELYIASGDTTDWSYGAHHIFSFTFELDPKDMWSGGFYPGQAKISEVLNKNIRPCLYLMDYADNPYRILEPTHVAYGLKTALVH